MGNDEIYGIDLRLLNDFRTLQKLCGKLNELHSDVPHKFFVIAPSDSFLLKEYEYTIIRTIVMGGWTSLIDHTKLFEEFPECQKMALQIVYVQKLKKYRTIGLTSLVELVTRPEFRKLFP